jgi:CHAD domain-containing protein
MTDGSIKLALPDKWIEAGTTDEAIHDVAVRTLQCRFGAVTRLLPLAAERADEDIEHIHDLRVWSRRAAAALELYAELMPRRRFLWIKKQLKRVRKAANEARDCDILIERLTKKQSSRATKRWLEELRAERRKSQETVVRVHKRLQRDDRFERRIDKLLRKVRGRSQEKAEPAPKSFAAWSREHLSPLVEQFFEAIPSVKTDEAALHRLRICGKQLRYDMELLAGAFPAEFRTKLYPTIKDMLDRLGEINDLVTAKTRLEQKLEASTRAADNASWRRLFSAENAKLRQVLRSFWDWCTPEMLQELRDGFEVMVSHSMQGRGAMHELQSDPHSAVSSPAKSEAGPAGQRREGFLASAIPAKTLIARKPGEPGLVLAALVHDALAANI